MPGARGIEADFSEGGRSCARSPAQLERARAEAEGASGYGLDVELLDAAAPGRLSATDVGGGTCSPHCALLHPANSSAGSPDRSEPSALGSSRPPRSTAMYPRRVRTTRGGPGRRRGPRNRRLHPSFPDHSAHPGAAVLADRRHRAAAPAFWDAERGWPAGDLRRPPPPDHLRPADRRRPLSSGAAGRPTTTARGSPRLRPRPDGPRRSARRCVELFPALAESPSPTAGAARSASPRDWHPPSASTVDRWPGPGLRRRRRRNRQTLPAGRSPT